MATTDRGSAAIMPADSTGTMLIGALTVTGTKHRAIAASDDGGLINCSCKRAVEAVLAPTSNRRLSHLERSDGCSGFSKPKFEIAPGGSVPVSVQNEMNS